MVQCMSLQQFCNQHRLTSTYGHLQIQPDGTSSLLTFDQGLGLGLVTHDSVSTVAIQSYTVAEQQLKNCLAWALADGCIADSCQSWAVASQKCFIHRVYRQATASISTLALRGSVFTAKHALAGGSLGKALPTGGPGTVIRMSTGHVRHTGKLNIAAIVDSQGHTIDRIDFLEVVHVSE